ncbi:MAG TPA: winged helix-turn-helix domain-containing protein, partial [Candidatus Eremiobacteraceae bacterium]|nr:winged helix-turn-helix domain-containing protein [Candidatus Eremiobacteraceae bacterium]
MSKQVIIEGCQEPMSTSYLCTLGSFSLQVGDRKLPSLATQKARALLAYLVLHRGADIGRERLMEVLWPEADPERARNSLNTALWSIRRSLRDAGLDPDNYLVASRSLIRWVADTTSDIARFHALATQADSAARQEALALYAGEFLEGDYEEWTVAEREKAAREYESLLSSVVVDSGDAEAAQLLINRNPYDEGAYAALIEAELAAGRLVAAAALVDRCRVALLEVGTAPTATFESRFGELALPKVQAPREFRLPFAGRGDELGALQSYLREASKGSGRVVLV